MCVYVSVCAHVCERPVVAGSVQKRCLDARACVCACYYLDVIITTEIKA